MTKDQHNLKPDSILQNYTIIRVLGEGGFGITYLAKDNELSMEVVIKEYFPNEFAMRSTDSTITAKSNSLGDFSKGMQRFKEESQTLAKFNHPSIVKILGYFEANNTAYFVMEYEEGIDLSKYLKQKDTGLKQEEILSIIMPILEGLKEVHAYNYLHRDIKPGNILLRANKSPVLIDFGASKLAMGEASKSVTSMLTEGYAPLEQYSTDIKQQGPFTDLYAVGAVIYRMIIGKVPPSSQTRSYQVLQDDNDPYEPLSDLQPDGFDEFFLYAIDKVLSIKAKERPQSVSEFQKMLVQTTPESPVQSLNKDDASSSGKGGVVWGWSVFFSVLPILLLGTLYLFLGGFSSSIQNNSMATTVQEPEPKKKKKTNELEQLKQYELSCNNGDETACKKELEYYHKMCKKGNAVRCRNQGWMYEHGKGVKKSFLFAHKYYQKSCSLGDNDACNNMRILETSELKKIDSYEQECEDGNNESCKKEAEYYKVKCNDGNAVRCRNLGWMYEHGKGVEQSLSYAKKYYKESCSMGDEDACNNVKILNEQSYNYR